MRVPRFIALGATVLALAGCGGGGGNQANFTITSAMLAGSGSGATPTTKKWKTVFLKVNGNYVGTGDDQPCPVVVDLKAGGGSTSCDPDDYLELRSDGTSRDFHAGTLETTFDDTWSVTGTTLNATTNSGGDRVVSSFTVTDAGIVGGRQRLRLRVLSETEPDGITLRPEDVGFEFVIEELP